MHGDRGVVEYQFLFLELRGRTFAISFFGGVCCYTAMRCVGACRRLVRNGEEQGGWHTSGVRVPDTHEQEAHAPLTAVSDADQQFGSGSRLLRSAEPTDTCLPWWNATAQGAGGSRSPYVRSRIGVRALGLVVLSCSTGWIPVWAPTEPWGLASGLASPRFFLHRTKRQGSTDMAKQRAHMYTPDDVVRSVLLGTKVNSACGDRRVLTREGVEAAVGLLPCGKCVKAVNDVHDEYTVRSARGWVALLERSMTDLLQQSKPKYSATLTGTFRYTGDWDVPLAG